MFNDDFTITVQFQTELDAVVTISEVHGGGMMLEIFNEKTMKESEIALNHEEVVKLISVLQDAEKYIKENK